MNQRRNILNIYLSQKVGQPTSVIQANLQRRISQSNEEEIEEEEKTHDYTSIGVRHNAANTV